MSDDLVERLERLKWMVHCEMRGLIPDTTAYEAAAEIRSLREQVARLREAAAAATCGDVGARAFEQIIADDIRYFDTRAKEQEE